jgi:hypothetical protein
VTRRTTRLDAAGVANRASQARAFLESARLHLRSSRADNSVAGTAAVHAGIAAADAICGKMIGRCARGENHDEAVSLLAEALADPGPSKSLARLLAGKSLAGYSAEMLADSRTAELVRYAERLVEAMERMLR